MIYFLVTNSHAFTMNWFLGSWGKALAGHINVVTYESLFAGKQLSIKDASFIFTLERLTPRGRALLGRFHDRLVKACGAARVLNDPMRSRSRFELLRTLHEAGGNGFDAWRAASGEVPARFPVFVRDERGSEPKAPPLVDSAASYDAAVRDLEARGVPREHIIAIEYCDTADRQGVYRKYGVFVVGERIVPRHLFFSRNWYVKDADLVLPAMLEEEQAFLEANPHAAALREVFRLAGIAYGRVDYSVLDGRIQIWEINASPVLTYRNDPDPLRREVHRRFADAIGEAFRALDARAT